jgi:hypothetical protein
VDYVEPPRWLWGGNVVVNDPIMQRWIDFRRRSLTDAIADVRAFIRELDPTIAVGVNIHGFSRSNRAIDGVDPVAICRETGVDGWGGENWVHPELTDDGVLISTIREHKACRTLDVAFTSGGRPPGGTKPLAKMVNLAFSHRRPVPGGGYLGGPFRFGYLNGPELFEPMRDHLEYFHDVETVADVAVLRSYPSIAYNSIGPLASTVGFEQTLIQAKIPFDIIFEEQLEDLSMYRVLVLANVECMTDEQIELVRRYVRQGGGLVATGSSSLYNQWRRSRPRFGLGDVLGLSESDARKTLNAYTTADAVSTWTGGEGLHTGMNRFGDGRAVYVPRVVTANNGPAAMMALPGNWPELVRAVEWAAGEELSVKVYAPLTVVMELTEQKEKGRIMLQLVNFKQTAVRDIGVDLKVPAGKKVASITLYSTDREGSSELIFNRTNGRIEFKIPELLSYELAVIRLEG